ncbi:MAG: hypothetical protein GY910_15400 [bacterium]|nr:hypothetical protein [bacterium]
MPRSLIAEGRAERLALDWVARVDRAVAEGEPAFPRYPLCAGLRVALFEARRARRVVRGLEGAEGALGTQERGLAQAAATRPEANRRRISRLLVVSADGSARFYRGVDRLRHRYAARLEAVLVECDEIELGGAVFGDGCRARALMIDHKEAVARFLGVLDERIGGAGSREDAASPSTAD